MNHPLGIIEIFYGAPWAWQDRLDSAAFLRQAGFDFYIYGPKADATLRKNWPHLYTREESARLQDLKKTLHAQKMKFGIALSPYALHENWNEGTKAQLRDKVRQLTDLGIDLLGLFFDDMKGSEELAHQQIEIVRFVEENTSAKIVFAPTYYSLDPLLDLFFGNRPERYLETLGENLSSKVEILWTGEKVISPEISQPHLQEVAGLLKRKPFICDNLYANDGPIHCHFLKIHSGEGRALAALGESSAWALNPMNQIHLSQIILLGFARYVRSGRRAEDGFREAVEKLCSESTAKIIAEYGDAFQKKGLSEMSEAEKNSVRSVLEKSPGPIEWEILAWLDGKYTVGFEALLD